MLKKILNEAIISFQIEATGPILIKEGDPDEEDNKQEPRNIMKFVEDANGEIFIPGSSIKGVWRSWCEKIARTISDSVFPISCDPFNKDETSKHFSCSYRLENKDPHEVYALSCPICRLFGNTSQGSRIRISDAYLMDKADKTRNNLPKRAGIGIDRFTGGVVEGIGPFQYQYIKGSSFRTCVQIRNFELWQLGLLAYLLKDFEEELVPIGYSKTRGFGKVKGTVDEMRIIYYGLKKPQVDTANSIEIKGIGTLYEDEDKDNYKFAKESSIKDFEILSTDENFIKLVLNLNESQAKSLFNECAPYWAGKDGDTYTGYFVHAQKMREDIINNNNHGGENA